MKISTFLLPVLILPLMASAQEPEDSSPSTELQEIVVEAPRVIHKADMDVYHPSQSAVDASANGMQLLGHLMIPALSVSDALGTIKSAGESVQVRINGRESTVEQVRALRPESIKRVEWIDNPGLRYGGAAYVLNFIISNPDAGGSLMTEARPGLNQAFGFYMADAKFNSGHSQWGVGGLFKLTDGIKVHRDYRETFLLPDGTLLSRNESPLGGEVDNSHTNAWLSYSYIKPDTTVFMAEFGWQSKVSDKCLYRGLLSMSDREDKLLLTDSQGNSGNTPGLSIYWQQRFRGRQTLVVDFNSSFYSGHTFSDYIEQRPDAAGYLTDIHTYIRDRNQAYGVEADYIKEWSHSRFTAGASYTANRNRSQYENLDGSVFHQRQDKVYLFAEYFRRLGKWTLTAGMGAQYTSFLFRESGRGNHSWSPRPRATVTYSPAAGHDLRLTFTSWQSTPSLTETNTVSVQLDGFQWRVGNPDIKTADSYMLLFSYRFNLPRVSATFGVRAFTSPNAITPLIMWSGDKMVTTYENSRGLQNLSFFIAPYVEIIPEWLSASGYLQFRMERMRGTGYDIRHNCWSGNASLRLSHWGFDLEAQYVRAQRDLWGEKISWGEDINIISLNYNLKDWQFGAGIIMPFGKYDQGSRSLSKWNRNEQHMRLDMRVPYIQVTYNLQWGRRNQGTQKLVNVDAAADRSSAGGR